MSIAVSNLDHLGIVAGIIDEIGLVKQINEQIGTDDREKISSGLVVKAMLLNGLGFVSSPLYLFSDFFEGKALEHLLREGIQAEYFLIVVLNTTSCRAEWGFNLRNVFELVNNRLNNGSLAIK